MLLNGGVFGVPGQPALGIGIPTRDRPEQLRNFCLPSLLHQDFRDFKLVIINDNSDPKLDNDFIWSEILPSEFRSPLDTMIIKGLQQGPPVAHKLAMAHLLGEGCSLVLRIDDDVSLMEPGALNNLLDYFDDPEVGAVGPIVWWGDKTFGQTIDTYYTTRLQWYDHKDPRPKSVAHLGTTFMYRLQDGLSCGGWPTNYSRVAYREEADFTMRVRWVVGHQIVIAPEVHAYHHLAKTGGIERESAEYPALEEQDKKTFLQNMGAAGISDPLAKLAQNYLGIYQRKDF